MKSASGEQVNKEHVYVAGFFSPVRFYYYSFHTGKHFKCNIDNDLNDCVSSSSHVKTWSRRWHHSEMRPLEVYQVLLTSSDFVHVSGTAVTGWNWRQSSLLLGPVRTHHLLFFSCFVSSDHMRMQRAFHTTSIRDVVQFPGSRTAWNVSLCFIECPLLGIFLAAQLS